MADLMPSEAFNEIPANGRPSGFMAEIDGSGAGSFQINSPVLIVGQRLPSGTVLAGIPQLIPGNGDGARTFFGQGSMAADMVLNFRKGNPTSTLYVIALDDNPAGVAATLDVTVVGTATAAGIVQLYIGGVRVQAAVAIGDNETVVAASIAAAINANADLMVTATSALGVVTVTARHKGEAANSLRLQLNFRGTDAGETTPAGLTITIPGDGSLAGGAGNPDQTPAITAMGDSEYDFIAVAYTDDASLDDWDGEMSSRWGPTRQLNGEVFTAKSGTLSELVTYGQNRNGKYVSICGKFDFPLPDWKTAVNFTAQASRALTNHPGRPLHTLKLVGEMAPPKQSAFTWSDRQALLYAGISTLLPTSDGGVVIDRAITTYQKNAYGQPDNSFLDVTTPATITRIVRELRFIIENTYILTRSILVDDGTPVGAGIPYCTPAKAKATMVAHYADRLMPLGLVENIDEFEKRLIVSRDSASGGDATRLNVKYTPDLANPLIVFAAQIAFSLAWPDSQSA